MHTVLTEKYSARCAPPPRYHSVDRWPITVRRRPRTLTSCSIIIGASIWITIPTLSEFLHSDLYAYSHIPTTPCTLQEAGNRHTSTTAAAPSLTPWPLTTLARRLAAPPRAHQHLQHLRQHRKKHHKQWLLSEPAWYRSVSFPGAPSLFPLPYLRVMCLLLLGLPLLPISIFVMRTFLLRPIGLCFIYC